MQMRIPLFKALMIMGKFFIFIVFSLCQGFQVWAQPGNSSIVRPKLVVGIVVDQMRWDFLYRYYDRYSEGGFKRMLKQGFSCENAYINYIKCKLTNTL